MGSVAKSGTAPPHVHPCQLLPLLLFTPCYLQEQRWKRGFLGFQACWPNFLIMSIVSFCQTLPLVDLRRRLEEAMAPPWEKKSNQ